uniref:C-type lectin domain-containing protein n=1 Tax=Periophthalmus magnuspinnatus TaxID=409849 RepID=A0A3B4B822_9GOBI
MRFNDTFSDLKLYLILALSALSNGGPRGFHLFRERKTWSEAQTFCRENYVDLATIETEEEFSIVVEMIRNLNIYPWIGLYDDYTSWRWSLDGKYLEHCAEISGEVLNDVNCGALKYPVCYDGEFTSKYCYMC